MDVIVDALLGTGFHGQVREPMASVIREINHAAGRGDHDKGSESEPFAHQPRVVAVDVPSGLDCQTGEASHATVYADVTVTFVARKTGFDELSAAAYLGEVVVAGIGAPVLVI